MSDDIVTRLRERAEERKEANDKYWRGYKFDYEIPELEDKAADEIERLREDVIYWQALSYCPKCGCGQCQDNEEALNNE